MKIFAITAAAVLASATTLIGVEPANAYTNCSGNDYYVTCTSSEYDYVSGKYVSCYGSGTPGYVTWTCNSY